MRVAGDFSELCRLKLTGCFLARATRNHATNEVGSWSWHEIMRSWRSERELDTGHSPYKTRHGAFRRHQLVAVRDRATSYTHSEHELQADGKWSAEACETPNSPNLLFTGTIHASLLLVPPPHFNLHYTVPTTRQRRSIYLHRNVRVLRFARVLKSQRCQMVWPSPQACGRLS